MSIMTYPLMERVPKNFKELAAAVTRGEYSCGATGGEAIWSAIVNSKSENIKIVRNNIINNGNFLSMSEWTEAVLKGQFAFVCNSDSLRQFVKKKDQNKFLVSEDSLMTFVQAYAMRKKFPFRKDLSKV
ncbi:uncharacterized protein [Centruroides vittatus]|uniref:uncharacterized protein n=1 Tax=Centruroides vittatus TaxID=120091 RepID=UPI00350FCA97